MFDNIQAFEIELKNCKSDVEVVTFKYFPNLQKQRRDLEIHEKPDIQIFQMQFSSIINSTIEKFYSRFILFKLFEETAKFIIFADSVVLHKMSLRKLQWIDLNSSPKHLLDLQRISIWRQT
jgi:hypothetical protein